MASEILIIGGGIIGLSIAREMKKRGVRGITVIDQAICGNESSWAAAGMLTPQAEADGIDIMFAACSGSRALFPQFAAELLDETGIDVGLDRTGTLYLAFTDSDERELTARFEKQRAAGLDVDRISSNDIRRSEPFISPGVRSGLFFANDWQVENRKVLMALKHFADINEINIIEDTAVDSVVVEDGKAVGVSNMYGKISGDQIVLATGSWTSFIQLGHSDMPIKIEPVKGQIVTFQTAKRLFDHVIYSPRGYMVPRGDGRILVGSTSEKRGFDKSISDAARERLTAVGCEIAPSLSGLNVVDHWSGLRPFASDGLPVIGPLNGIEGLFFATGHYRNGILLAPLTAKIVADQIIDHEHSTYIDAFSPNRWRFASARKN